MAPKRFAFKSNVEFDIALLSEVESLNPFASKTPKPIWDEIANILKNSEWHMQVTGRSCKDRTELLLKDFGKEETLSKRLSGVAEDSMNKVKYLLTSISKLKLESTTLSPIYSRNERKTAEKTRKAVLLDLEQNISSDDDDPVIQVNGEETSKSGSNPSTSKQDAITQQPKPDADDKTDEVGGSKKRFRKNEVISFLTANSERKFDLKREELKIKSQEIENRKQELLQEKEKLQIDAELKRNELALRKEKQDAEIDEKNQLMNVLFTFIQKM